MKKTSLLHVILFCSAVSAGLTACAPVNGVRPLTAQSAMVAGDESGIVIIGLDTSGLRTRPYVNLAADRYDPSVGKLDVTCEKWDGLTIHQDGNMPRTLYAFRIPAGHYLLRDDFACFNAHSCGVVMTVESGKIQSLGTIVFDGDEKLHIEANAIPSAEIRKKFPNLSGPAWPLSLNLLNKAFGVDFPYSTVCGARAL